MKLTENFKNIISLVKEYYWIAGIPFLVFGFILTMNNKEDINQNQTETYGMIYDSTPIYKKYSKRIYKYEFYYKSKKYTGTSTAYISKNVENGNFYKVEFSDKNPENSRMNFDSEYVREFKTNENGKVTDTIFVLKGQEMRNEIKELIEKYEYKTDSKKN